MKVLFEYIPREEQSRVKVDKGTLLIVRLLAGQRSPWGFCRTEKSLIDGLWPWRPGLFGEMDTWGCVLMISVPVL